MFFKYIINSYKTSTFYISVEFIESTNNKSIHCSAISVKVWDVVIKVEEISEEKKKSLLLSGIIIL